MNYTPGIDRIIRDRFAAGDDDAEIGEIIRRTGSAVKTRRLKLGLLRERAPSKFAIKIPTKAPKEEIVLRLDPMVLRDLTQRARKAGVERNKFIRLFIYKWLGREKAA